MNKKWRSVTYEFSGNVSDFEATAVSYLKDKQISVDNIQYMEQVSMAKPDTERTVKYTVFPRMNLHDYGTGKYQFVLSGNKNLNTIGFSYEVFDERGWLELNVTSSPRSLHIEENMAGEDIRIDLYEYSSENKYSDSTLKLNSDILENNINLILKDARTGEEKYNIKNVDNCSFSIDSSGSKANIILSTAFLNTLEKGAYTLETVSDGIADEFRVRKVMIMVGEALNTEFISAKSLITDDTAKMRFIFKLNIGKPESIVEYGAYIVPLSEYGKTELEKAVVVKYTAAKNPISESGKTFSVDLNEIPMNDFDKQIIAIPYVITSSSSMVGEAAPAVNVNDTNALMVY